MKNMKTINGIACALFILLVFGFVSTLLIPFFTFDPPANYVAPSTDTQETKPKDDDAEPVLSQAALVFNEDGKVVFTLGDYLLTKTTQVNDFLAEVIEGYKVKKKYDTNAYVTLLAVTIGLAITTTISHACSRKAVFTQISSFAYCGFAVVCAFTCKILPYGAPIVQTIMIVTSIAASVVCLARVYPWYKYRYAKKTVKQA